MKKLLLAILMIFLGTSMCVFAFEFPDVPDDHPAAKQIDFLSETGIVVGYPDGTFRPDENVTRAEFATMAIKSLSQQHARVDYPMEFTDVAPDYWAYDAVKKALYFELVTADTDFFRPDDIVSRAEALTVAVNALADKTKNTFKSKKQFTDAQAQEPATRAETAVFLYEMIEQVRTNPNPKIAEAMSKKHGEGYPLNGVVVNGNVATTPAGAIMPVGLRSYLSSQTSLPGDLYNAFVPYNYVTKEKYMLIEKNSMLKGQIADAKPGRLFVRNGVLVLNNSTITTTNDQSAVFSGVCDIRKRKNGFMKFVRTVFKGEKLDAPPGSVIYMQLKKPVKIDLSNGWILE